jgi:hypothetical protein
MADFRRFNSEAGFAMMTVVMGMAAMVFLVLLIFQDASREYTSAQDQRRDDSVIVAAEAMLERYAAKLVIDRQYHFKWVDEAEMPRRCSDPKSIYNGLVAEPGTAWFSDCTLWDYSGGDPYAHPLLSGDAARTSDDVTALLAVNPPGPADSGVEVTVVANLDEFGQARGIRATIAPEAISEFAFLVEGDLRFGSGANIHGKIYVGGDLNFRLAPSQGVVHRDVFAEGRIGNLTPLYGPPVFVSGAQGYAGSGAYPDIRTVYEDPLDFTNFWDDIELLREVACSGAGLCLSASENPALGLPGTPTAWLLEPVVAGGASQIRVSAAYSSNSYDCVTSEEWWWIHSQDASWTTVGTFPVPASGAVWVDGHTVMGIPPEASKVLQPFTVLAGSVGSRKNIIIGSDIIYPGGKSDDAVIGLIATDELYINPDSVGSDLELTINAAILTQDGAFHVARTCGSSGYVMLPVSGGVPRATLHTNGSFAIRYTGDVAASFGERNYVFDTRFETLRPPFFPLMGDSWTIVQWREEPLPCWALADGC